MPLADDIDFLDRSLPVPEQSADRTTDRERDTGNFTEQSGRMPRRW